MLALRSRDRWDRSPCQRGIPPATSARQPLPGVAVAKRYDTNLKTLCLSGGESFFLFGSGSRVRE